MSKLKAWFTHKWFIQSLGLLALSVLVWLAGPLIAIAGYVPLDAEWTRALVIVGLWGIWIIYRLLMQIHASKTEQQLVEQLMVGEADHIAVASADEVQLLSKGFEEALGVLKQSRSASKAGKQFIDQLPWYAIIGAPGSGKTTALINSGLHFPLADKLGKYAIRGVSGTRNCDWWFADQAVFLDTAGRYTTQESHQAVDAAGWAGFLKLLKKYRPRRPLNGVIVATSIADLLQQTEPERLLHAKAIRARIQELYQQLGVNLPVYLLFTKADLVAGFNDFFADLNAEQRTQVWGETFPAAGVDGDPEVLAQFSKGYAELLQRLQSRTLARIQDELDVKRRAAILDFPQQMALLKPTVLDFLQATFAANRYDQPPLLRGVYFTSATQEGTPIDRVLTILAGAFRVDKPVIPLYSGQGKSFFLTRLLQEVLFPEMDLAGQDPKLAKRAHWRQLTTYIGAGLVCATLMGLWTASYVNNQNTLDKVEEHLAQYQAIKLDDSDSQDNFKVLLPHLNLLQQTADVYQHTGLLSGLGLSQGDKIQAAAHHSYAQLLREYFLPSVQARLKARMQGSEGSNPDVLYQLLKVYLMFKQPDRLDPATATAWIRADWDRQYASEPETIGQLLTHLDKLLKLKFDPVQVDDDFVNAVRGKLTQVPLIGQIYARFKTEALLDKSHDLSLDKLTGTDGAKVLTLADGKAFSSYSIPGLYTAYGYSELFLKKNRDFVKQAVQQNWVLGDQSLSETANLESLQAELKQLYLNEYQTVWTTLLGKLKLQPALTTTQTAQMLDILSRPEGPLRTLLSSIDEHTSLGRLSKQASDALIQAADKLLAATDDKTKQLLAVAKGAAVDNNPALTVENQFAPLSNLVHGNPIALEPVLAQLKNLRDYFLQLGSANTGGQALKNQENLFSGAGVDALKQAQVEFSHLPPPINGWLQGVVNSSGQKLSSAAKQQLSKMAKTTVATPCKAALNGRYPFFKGARQDMLLADFSNLFAPSGLLEQFFQNNLKAFVDTSKPVWTEMSSDKPLGLSIVSLRQFQLAAKIRAAFFAAGATPQVQFELKPLSMDAAAATFRLLLEGQELVYQPGKDQAMALKWPGPNTSLGVTLVFEPKNGSKISRIKEGAWAFFHVLDDAALRSAYSPDKFDLTFQAEGFNARFELRAASVNNPFNLSALQSFRCPDGL